MSSDSLDSRMVGKLSDNNRLKELSEMKVTFMLFIWIATVASTILKINKSRSRIIELIHFEDEKLDN
jgi:hypothetical protein